MPSNVTCKDWIVGGGLFQLQTLICFRLVKVVDSLSSYAAALLKVSDFTSTNIQILDLVTAMYLVFRVCEFTKWHSYRLWLNSNLASS